MILVFAGSYKLFQMRRIRSYMNKLARAINELDLSLEFAAFFLEVSFLANNVRVAHVHMSLDLPRTDRKL